MCSLDVLFSIIERNRISENYPLSGLTTIRLGGPAKYHLRVLNRSELSCVIKELKKYDCPWLILGEGSNIIFSDKGFKGAIIQLEGDFKSKKIRNGMSLFLGGGVKHSELTPWSVENGISGLEFMSGYPGTIGGDIFGNSGSREQTTADRLLEVEWLDCSSLTYQWVPGKALLFSYRKSAVHNKVVCGGSFVFEASSKEDIIQKCKTEIQRRQNQPRFEASAGCIFKNLSDKSAGEVIDECGLKEASVGGMCVSPKHANFIVNKGKGSQEDLKQLIDIIRSEVYRKTGHQLQLEVRIINEKGSVWS